MEEHFHVKLKFYFIALLNWIVGMIPWAASLDWISRIMSIVIAVLVFILTRRKYHQDMKLAKLEEYKKTLEIENLQQAQYHLMEQNKKLRGGKDGVD